MLDELYMGPLKTMAAYTARYLRNAEDISRAVHSWLRR